MSQENTLDVDQIIENSAEVIDLAIEWIQSRSSASHIALYIDNRDNSLHVYEHGDRGDRINNPNYELVRIVTGYGDYDDFDSAEDHQYHVGLIREALADRQ